MAKAAAVPGIEEGAPFALVAARVVAVRTRELVQYSAGVLDVYDIERVHDMRVATRRLRAALEVFEPCFPRKRFKAALREAKQLADALGERRDRDVAIAALIEIEAAMGATESAGIESLVAALRAEQAEANDALTPFVSERRLGSLRARLDELVAEAESLVARPDASDAPALRVVA